MHSIRPQKLAAIGLDPDTLLARNPRLVYVGLHGFAEDGPYGGMPAYDDIIQGLSGCAALMERQAGAPQYFPTIAADKTSGLVATHAILAALFRRERTGKGGYVEVPMLESMVSFNLVEHFYGHHFAPPLADTGYPRLFAKHRRPYRTADGYLCAMPYTDAHWKRFFTEGGMPEAAADPRFANITERTQEHRCALHAGRAGDRDAQHRRVARRLRAPRSAGLAHEPARRPAGRRAPEGHRLLQDHRRPEDGHAALPRRAGAHRPPATAGAHGAAPGRAHPPGPERSRHRAACHRTTPHCKEHRYDRTRIAKYPLLGHGFFWQDLEVGQKFQTFNRTVTETDLVNFISCTGMLEIIFIDAEGAASAIGGRPVPAALTYSLIEGFILQTMIQGTGMAMLECTQKVLGPVRVNDTIHAVVEVAGVKPTSKGNRAIVDSNIEVFNQRGEPVLRYTARRMLAGRPES